MTMADPGVQELAEAALDRFPLASRTGPGAEDSDHRSLASLRLNGERRGEIRPLQERRRDHQYPDASRWA
jgi:hypothetical protein